MKRSNSLLKHVLNTANLYRDSFSFLLNREPNDQRQFAVVSEQRFDRENIGLFDVVLDDIEGYIRYIFTL